MKVTLVNASGMVAGRVLMFEGLEPSAIVCCGDPFNLSLTIGALHRLRKHYKQWCQVSKNPIEFKNDLKDLGREDAEVVSEMLATFKGYSIKKSKQTLKLT